MASKPDQTRSTKRKPKPSVSWQKLHSCAPADSHDRAIRLLALIHVAILLVGIPIQAMPPLGSPDADLLRTTIVPPAQHLLLRSRHAVAIRDDPAAAGGFDRARVARKVVLGQEDLRHDVVGGGFAGLEREGEDHVAKVEAVGLDAADGGDGRWSDVGFCGAEAWMGDQVGRAGGNERAAGGRDGGSGEGVLEGGGRDAAGGRQGSRGRVGGRGSINRGGGDSGRSVGLGGCRAWEGRVVERVNGEIFAIPSITPFMNVLSSQQESKKQTHLTVAAYVHKAKPLAPEPSRAK